MSKYCEIVKHKTLYYNMLYMSYSSCVVLSYQEYGYFDDNTTDQKILECMDNPGTPECIPWHGYPMDRAMVAAGFKENATKFDTLKITLVNTPLNLNYPMISLRSEWEYYLEGYLENQRQILANDNVFLTYLTRHNNFFNTNSTSDSNAANYLSVVCGLAHLFYLSFILRLGSQPRVILAVSIVSINILSILSALGCLSFFGFKAPENLLDVMPFVFMSVGADNMVMLVLFCQNKNRKFLESNTFGTHIGRSLCLIGPTLRVNSWSAILCSCLAAISTNDFARALSIYMAVALSINWLLQETCFVAVLALELQRTARLKE